MQGFCTSFHCVMGLVQEILSVIHQIMGPFGQTYIAAPNIEAYQDGTWDLALGSSHILTPKTCTTIPDPLSVLYTLDAHHLGFRV